MKKLSIILLAVVMAFSLSSCAPSPTDVAGAFLEAIKAQDGEAIAENYVNEEFDLFDEASNADSDEESDSNEDDGDNALTKVYEENLYPKMLEFEYELSNEKVDGDKATVDVAVTTYQLGSAFTSFFGEYMSQAFALAFSDTSDEKITALGANILNSKLDELTEKTYQKTTTLTLIKKDDKWVVDKVAGNKDALNALSGGFVDAVSNMSTAFED